VAPHSARHTNSAASRAAGGSGAVAALHEMQAHAGNRRGPVPKPRPETDRIERRERVRRGRVDDIVGHGELLVLKEGRSAALP
jgi:hypothetical protein